MRKYIIQGKWSYVNTHPRKSGLLPPPFSCGSLFGDRSRKPARCPEKVRGLAARDTHILRPFFYLVVRVRASKTLAESSSRRPSKSPRQTVPLARERSCSPKQNNHADRSAGRDAHRDAHRDAGSRCAPMEWSSTWSPVSSCRVFCLIHHPKAAATPTTSYSFFSGAYRSCPAVSQRPMVTFFRVSGVKSRAVQVSALQGVDNSYRHQGHFPPGSVEAMGSRAQKPLLSRCKVTSFRVNGLARSPASG